MPSVEPLARVYIDALCGRAILIHAGLKGGLTYFGFEQFRGKGIVGRLVAKFWFQRPAHAELVVLRCQMDFAAVGANFPDGIDLPPLEVIDKVKKVAAELGAKWHTQAQIERDAELAVAEVTRQVAAARQNGGLKKINQDYAKYRKAQMEKGELAVPYQAYLAEFTRLMVLRTAQKAMQ